MKRNITACLFAWWFIANVYGARVQGPFATREQCEQIKAQLKHVFVTDCWDDGKRRDYTPRA